jgi:mRNA interferase MazF
MITSNMARAGHPSRVTVRLSNETATGSALLMDSMVMGDNLATVHDSEIDQVIGRITMLEEFDAALRATLGL